MRSCQPYLRRCRHSMPEGPSLQHRNFPSPIVRPSWFTRQAAAPAKRAVKPGRGRLVNVASHEVGNMPLVPKAHITGQLCSLCRLEEPWPKTVLLVPVNFVVPVSSLYTIRNDEQLIQLLNQICHTMTSSLSCSPVTAGIE